MDVFAVNKEAEIELLRQKLNIATSALKEINKFFKGSYSQRQAEKALKELEK